MTAKIQEVSPTVSALSDSVITPIMVDDTTYILVKELCSYLSFSRLDAFKRKLKNLGVPTFKITAKNKDAITVTQVLELLPNINKRISKTTELRRDNLIENIGILNKGLPYPTTKLETLTPSKTSIITTHKPKNTTKNNIKKQDLNTITNTKIGEKTPDVNTKLEEMRVKITLRVESFSVYVMTAIYCVAIPIALILRELSKAFHTKEFVFLVLLLGLFVQVNHNATLFASVSSIDNETTKWILSYLFGAVAELTALLLTIHQAKEKTIKQFAFFTFIVNLFYYKIWEGWNGELVDGELVFNALNFYTKAMVKIVQSGFLAFVIYSYSNLFTLESMNKTE